LRHRIMFLPFTIHHSGGIKAAPTGPYVNDTKNHGIE
jgi:hypothetical protein